MVQIIQENKRPTFGQQLNEGLGRGLETLQQYQQMAKEQEELQQQQAKQQKFADEVQRLYGIDVSALPLEEMSKFALEGFKGSQKAEETARKFKGEKEEKLIPLEGALSSIDEMINIRKKGNLGLGVGFRSSIGRGETARDKGAYETLGNSLISYATSIPIRNRVEFEKLAGNISDPSISDAEAEGILTKLRKIIEDSTKQYEENEVTTPKRSKRPDLSSFFED